MRQTIQKRLRTSSTPTAVRCAASTLLIAVSLFAHMAGTRAAAEEGASEPDLVQLFIDCNYCDYDHIRREIRFVHHVRDRKQADVHLIVTRQSTASNGWNYSLNFIGLGRFVGLVDTLEFVSSGLDTEYDIREGLTRRMSQGLTRFASRTAAADSIRVDYEAQEAGGIALPPTDKWNQWWFSLGANGSVGGEQSYGSRSVSGNASAQRITEEIKIRFWFWANHYKQTYSYAGVESENTAESRGGEGSSYWSVGERWAVGIAGSAFQSDYSNRDLSLTATPGLEFNVFPYSESTRRQLRLTYEVGAIWNDYQSETVYGQTEEFLWHESLRATLELIQPWGSASATLAGAHYFHDPSLYHLRMSGSVAVRLIEGLSIVFSGSYARVHDQVALRKGLATEEEVLLRLRELETNYTFWSSVGLSYSFGSRHNNVVNPRFGR